MNGWMIGWKKEDWRRGSKKGSKKREGKSLRRRERAKKDTMRNNFAKYIF